MSGLAPALVELTGHLSGVLTARSLAHAALAGERRPLQQELEDLEEVVAEALVQVVVPEATLGVLRGAEALLDELLDGVAPLERPAASLEEAVVGLFDGLCVLRARHGYGVVRDDAALRRTARAFDGGLAELRRAWSDEELAAATGLVEALDARVVARLERLA